ncbi:hypothetical protein ACHAXA_004832 [Cyclostephanos tholiformis]|uniref:Uncharacterized protein n=1 Tax=Cyclostephanos tholiformis TaxID=382380 RepID=A0ABD3SGU2_9STRA
MLNMSLRRISPRLMARCNGNNSGTAVALSSRSTKTPCVPHVSRRAFSTPYKADSKSTAEEMEAALEKANESMKAYYSYPPEKIIAAKKLRFKQRLSDRQFYLQLGLSVSLVCTFLITPFLGRKIAYDEEFKEKYVPSWYDFTVEKPKNAWTKEELQREITMLQTRLHERAIAGEFTPEKLEEMRRTIHKKPEKEEFAHFAKMHPGVDDDEELED